MAECYIEQFVCRFGVPDRLHTDQGGDFESTLFKEVNKLLGIHKTRTTPYRPQSDGLIERFNRTVQQMLAVLVNEARDNWDDHLPYVMLAYRSSVQESTKFTPNRLMLGREVSLPIDLMVPKLPGDEDQCSVLYAEWVKNATNEAFQLVRDNLKLSAQRQKKYYDRNSGPQIFKEGEWVWYYYPPKAKEKLGQPWQGPYLIKKQLSDVTFKLQLNAAGDVKVDLYIRTP